MNSRNCAIANRRRILTAFIVSMFIHLAGTLIYLVVVIPSMPETAAGKYVDCLKSRDYEGAILYYMDTPVGPMTGEKHIEAALCQVYGDASEIIIKYVKPSGEEGEYSAVLEIRSEDTVKERVISLHNTTSSMMGLMKEWKVAFPFEVGNVYVRGVNGSKVYVDGTEAGEITVGHLIVNGVIRGSHSFDALIPGIASSLQIIREISEYDNIVEIKLKADKEFQFTMEELVRDFCKGWSDYCLSQDPEKIKPYLNEELYGEYTGSNYRFNGSKYTVCRYDVDFGDLEILDKENVTLAVDEIWHLKEVITEPDLVFKDNNSTVLEQGQYISWKYHIALNGGMWKIDSAEQLSFRQEIIKQSGR